MGFILIDKPAGITSHDVVVDVKKIFLRSPVDRDPRSLRGPRLRVGHAGTLDPFATGLLIVLLGPATRLAEYTLGLTKIYETEITLGATSDTDDATGHLTPLAFDHLRPPPLQQGEVKSPKTFSPLTKGEYPAQPGVGVIETTLHSFVGTIQQVPPAYAATKIKGRRAYTYARAGESVQQKSRPIKIYEIKLLQYNYPTLQLSITCGQGTYIRALARDIGASLKTGGYCSTLRRLAIGQFSVKEAWPLADLPTKLSTTLLSDKLLVDHLPKIILSADNVAKFKQGKAVAVSTNLMPNTTHTVLDDTSKLIGLGQPDPSSPTLLRPHKVLGS